MDYSKYLKDFKQNTGISDNDILRLKLPIEIPAEYIEFLKICNGGEGSIGEEYVILYRAEELKQVNIYYEVEKNVPGIFLFGSNGGAEAFAFDFRKKNKISYVLIPFIFDYDDVIILGRNIKDFFERIYKEDFFD